MLLVLSLSHLDLALITILTCVILNSNVNDKSVVYTSNEQLDIILEAKHYKPKNKLNSH